MNTEQDAYLSLLKSCLTASIYQESGWQAVTSRNRLKRWLLGLLARRSYLLIKRARFDHAKREIGGDWPLFGYSMIGRKRLDNIQECINQIIKHDIPGDFIETGVWRGGAVIFMRALLRHYGIRDRIVWAADSFEGLPKPDVATYGSKAGHDLSEEIRLKVSLEEVKENFSAFGLLDDQVRFLKGWFRDTLPGAPIKQLALLRLDGDLYESTMDALDALYHRVSPGGFVIVDDYGSWESCKLAVHDFRAKHQINEEIKPIDWTGVYWQVARSR